MKTQKIFLLVVLLLLSLALVACGPSSSEAEAYFVFEDKVVYTDVKDLDGEPISYNADYNLIALATEDTSVFGDVERTISVYNLNTGKVVFEDRRPLIDNTPASDVDISSYPVVKVSYAYHESNDEYGNPIYNDRHSYYLLNQHESSEQIAYGLEYDDLEVEEVGNVFVVKTETTVYWINKNLETVRTSPAPISDSYESSNLANYFNFKAEYEDYLYAWEFKQESQMIVVYNPHGVASAKFNFTPGAVLTDGMTNSLINPKVFVLDNGCVLVQECISVTEEGAEWDFEYLGTKLKLATSVMNYKTGEVKPIECDFVILNLESAYARPQNEDSSEFPFELKESGNQAYIVKINNGMPALTMDYVVLDDMLTVKYTLPNKYLAEQCAYDTIELFNKESYFAEATVNGITGNHLFDLNGNLIFTEPTNCQGVTSQLYFTESAIYDHSGEMVFDIESSHFAGNEYLDIDTLGDRIIIEKYNYETSEIETYIWNEREKIAELITDGEYSNVVTHIDDTCFVIYDDDKLVSSVYNINGEILLKVQGRANVRELDGKFFVTAEVDGKTVTYILSEPSVESEEQ